MFKKWFKNKQMENNETLHNEDLMQDESVESTENAGDTTENTDNNPELLALQEQITELKNKILYQQAEFDNFRKRTQKEKAEVIAMASRDTLTSLLPVLDDFDRASKNEVFTEGVNLVWHKLISTLKNKGLKDMESPAGSDFDPDQHEAITEIPAGDELVGKIVDTVEKGYILSDKIIRFAKVVVGK
jgi:molecular chaperone GrpE